MKYKIGKNVIDLLCDIVSRNGNLMLNIPLPNSGKPDDEELKMVEGITQWMAVNSEGIYGTRPWKISGNPPAAPAPGQFGFNERNRKDLTANDVRYTTKGGDAVRVRDGLAGAGSGDSDAGAWRSRPGRFAAWSLLGHRGKLKFTQDAAGLKISCRRRRRASTR